MLSESADKRPSAEEALNHDFLRKPTNNKIQDIGMIENFINFQNELNNYHIYKYIFIINY